VNESDGKGTSEMYQGRNLREVGRERTSVGLVEIILRDRIMPQGHVLKILEGLSIFY
jgi:hypothetical protein